MFTTAMTPEQIAHAVRFFHPDKIFAGLSDRALAERIGITVEEYVALREANIAITRQAAEELLGEGEFAGQVARLPFKDGESIVAFGDSITDDQQSWIEILRHVLAIARPAEQYTVINSGIGGHSTSMLLGRFLNIVQMKPEWLITFVGTNDARRHGLHPAKTLVSLEETAKNLAALRKYALEETPAKLVWMTPPKILSELMPTNWYEPQQTSWLPEDLAAIAEEMKKLPDPVVDLQPVFGDPVDPDCLISDGLHPSIKGQKAILRALVERLSRPVTAVTP